MFSFQVGLAGMEEYFKTITDSKSLSISLVRTSKIQGLDFPTFFVIRIFSFKSSDISRAKTLSNKFNAALWPKNAQERANVAAAATFSHVLTSQLRVEQAARASAELNLKKVTEENNKLKGASKMPKQSVTSQQSARSNSTNDRIKMNASDAIDMGLDEAGN